MEGGRAVEVTIRALLRGPVPLPAPSVGSACRSDRREKWWGQTESSRPSATSISSRCLCTGTRPGSPFQPRRDCRLRWLPSPVPVPLPRDRGATKSRAPVPPSVSCVRLAYGWSLTSEFRCAAVAESDGTTRPLWSRAHSRLVPALPMPRSDLGHGVSSVHTRGADGTAPNGECVGPNDRGTSGGRMHCQLPQWQKNGTPRCHKRCATSATSGSRSQSQTRSRRLCLRP